MVILMSNNIKNYLAIALICFWAIMATLAGFAVHAYSKSVTSAELRSFTVSGTGKILALPDVAKFTFSIVSEGGKDLGVLQKATVEKGNKAIEFIKSSGVDSKDIKTQNYSVEPRYQYFSCPPSKGGPCPPAEIVGYTISQTILVKVRDFDKTGNILSGVVDRGANMVGQLEFTIDDPTEVQNRARAEAILKAREKAESIARAGGFDLGDLISIEETGGSVPPIYSNLYRKEGIGFPADYLPAPTVEPGSEEVSVSVVLRYEIE